MTTSLSPVPGTHAARAYRPGGRSHQERYPQYPLCLLTNGTLFLPRARDQINQIDLIVPSLDAASEEVFRKLNRPHPDLDCKDVISDWFPAARIQGEICMEVFIVPGLNDTDEEPAAIKSPGKSTRTGFSWERWIDRDRAWVKEAAEQDVGNCRATGL